MEEEGLWGEELIGGGGPERGGWRGGESRDWDGGDREGGVVVGQQLQLKKASATRHP